jgi:DNA-binding NarL/FixJ family response regulator
MARGVGYLVKDRVQDSDRLVDAIRWIAASETAIDPEIVERVMVRRRFASSSGIRRVHRRRCGIRRYDVDGSPQHPRMFEVCGRGR